MRSHPDMRSHDDRQHAPSSIADVLHELASLASRLGMAEVAERARAVGQLVGDLRGGEPPSPAQPVDLCLERPPRSVAGGVSRAQHHRHSSQLIPAPGSGR